MKESNKQYLAQLRKNMKSRTVAISAVEAPCSLLLWQAATTGVIPIKASIKVAHPPMRKLRSARMEAEPSVDRQDGMGDFWPWDQDSVVEGRTYVRPGQKLDTLRRLKKGYWPSEARLDLHGLGIDQARNRVGCFVKDMCALNRRCVIIVHGKGLSSPGGISAIKMKLANWLVQRDEVLAFAEAPPHAGGAGATLILLRSPNKRNER